MKPGHRIDHKAPRKADAGAARLASMQYLDTSGRYTCDPARLVGINRVQVHDTLGKRSAAKPPGDAASQQPAGAEMIADMRTQPKAPIQRFGGHNRAPHPAPRQMPLPGVGRSIGEDLKSPW
jgi:hypothetical protein